MCDYSTKQCTFVRLFKGERESEIFLVTLVGIRFGVLDEG